MQEINQLTFYITINIPLDKETKFSKIYNCIFLKKLTSKNKLVIYNKFIKTNCNKVVHFIIKNGE